MPDVVIDSQGKSAIQILGVVEHSEQIANIINVLLSDNPEHKPLASAIRYFIEHRRTLGAMLSAKDMHRFAKAEFLKGGLLPCVKTFFCGGFKYAFKQKLGQ